MSRNDICKVECELKHETGLAYLIVVDNNEVWVPKSISHYEPTTADEVLGEIELPEWFAQEEGLI